MQANRKRGLAALVAVLFMFGGYSAGAHSAHSTATVYRKAHGGEPGLPEAIVLRRCFPTEDTLSRLRMIRYEAGELLVLRCWRP